MVDRLKLEKLLHQLYAARVSGRLDELCALFSREARFRIVGTSDGKPVAVSALGRSEIRSWLAMMVKTFKLTQHEILSTLIDDTRAAVHWRADIQSRITGAVVPTELIDLIEARGEHIISYIEYFVPC